MLQEKRERIAEHKDKKQKGIQQEIKQQNQSKKREELPADPWKKGFEHPGSAGKDPNSHAWIDHPDRAAEKEQD